MSTERKLAQEPATIDPTAVKLPCVEESTFLTNEGVLLQGQVPAFARSLHSLASGFLPRSWRTCTRPSFRIDRAALTSHCRHEYRRRRSDRKPDRGATRSARTPAGHFSRSRSCIAHPDDRNVIRFAPLGPRNKIYKVHHTGGA